MRARQLRHLIVLLVGFLASIVVSSTFARPYVAFQTQPIVQQMLLIFLLPTTATVIYVATQILQKRQLLIADAMIPDPAVQAIVFWILLFLTGVHFMVLTVVVGVEAVQPWASRAVAVLIGLTLVAIGNLLPRTRPNLVLGIRTSRTLVDRSLWMFLHRAGGYICVAVGIITIVTTAFLSGPTIAAVCGVAIIAGSIIMYVYYQRLTRWRSSRGIHA